MRFWDPNNKGEGPLRPGSTRYTLRTTFEGRKVEVRMDVANEYAEYAESTEYAEIRLKEYLARRLVEKLEAEGRLAITAHTVPESWF